MAAWYDPVAELAEVLALLRLQGDDFDVDTIEGLLPAQADTIDAYLDRVDPMPDPTPPAILRALEVSTVAAYHRQATTATLGAGVADVGAVGGRAEPFDPLADCYVWLGPWKQQWAVA